MPGDPQLRAAIEQARLSNGRPVNLRRAAAGDLVAVRDFYRQLNDESTYYRFFAIRRPVPEQELRDVVGATDQHVTMLATADDQLIGIGEYIVGNDPEEAEVAFVVADDHHREGVATLLLERLAVIAHEKGLLRFIANVLPDNDDMKLVFRTVGLTTHRHFDDGVVKVTLDLTSVGALLTAAESRALQTPSDDQGLGSTFVS